MGWCGIWAQVSGTAHVLRGRALGVRLASLAVPLRNPFCAVICPVGGVAAMYDRPE